MDVLRVLLINPSMNLQKLGRFAGLLEPMPCIGLAYIAAALEQHGCHVRVIDMFAERLDVQQVVDKAVRFGPDLVGMTVLTPSAPVCSAISQRMRSRIPEAKIVWGGVHADVFGPEIVRSGDQILRSITTVRSQYASWWTLLLQTRKTFHPLMG